MYRFPIALVLAFGMSLPMAAFGKTPDGQTPAQEHACDGLTGGAKGTCTAYCEAQDCDQHERPSCEQLRKNFEKKTGSRTFPCDHVACGDAAAPACNGECPADQVCALHVNGQAACVCESPPAVCAGEPCEGGGDCTTQFCDTSAGSPGVCAQVCADPSTTCVCGGDCTTGFCDDSGGSPGHCAPVCAAPGTTCVCGGDCTSGFCDDSGGSPGHCAPLCAGASTTCACGGDCTSGFCDDSGGSPGHCGAVCAGPGTTCTCGGDCTSGFCDDSLGLPGQCAPVFDGGPCGCGADCVSGFCDDSLGLPGVCGGVL